LNQVEIDDSAILKEIDYFHAIHSPPKEIRTVRFKMSPKTVSSLPPSDIWAELHRCLLDLKKRTYGSRLFFERKSSFYAFHVVVEAAGDFEKVEFETEVCKVWLLKVHGVKIKRLSGSAYSFKEMYRTLTTMLKL
jgi:hypothetical protein